MSSLFGVALDVADVGGDLHGSVWFRPEAAVDCVVQRGLNIKDTCDSFFAWSKMSMKVLTLERKVIGRVTIPESESERAMVSENGN